MPSAATQPLFLLLLSSISAIASNYQLVTPYSEFEIINSVSNQQIEIEINLNLHKDSTQEEKVCSKKVNTHEFNPANRVN